MMIAQVAGLSFGRYVLWCIAPVLFALACAYGHHLGDSHATAWPAPRRRCRRR